MAVLADVFLLFFLSRLEMSSACSTPEGAATRPLVRLISPNHQLFTTLLLCETRMAMPLSCSHGLISDHGIREMLSRPVSRYQ